MFHAGSASCSMCCLFPILELVDGIQLLSTDSQQVLFVQMPQKFSSSLLDSTVLVFSVHVDWKQELFCAGQKDLSTRVELTFDGNLRFRKNCFLLIYARRSVEPTWRKVGQTEVINDTAEPR